MKIETLYDICKICEASQGALIDMMENKRKYYKPFYISKKSGGSREIIAPIRGLKNVQRRILRQILYNNKFYRIHSYAYGFRRGKSIISNAYQHSKKNLILKLDIKDFFPSIKYDRIKEMFDYLGMNSKVSKYITELVTFNEKLPQGAPTSPYISNMVCKKLDTRLFRYARKCRIKYSRYADDLTFSGNSINGKFIGGVIRIIKDEGFSINYNKKRIIGQGAKQIVTGLVVNEKVGIGRKKYRLIRSLIHKYRKFDLSILRYYLLGKISLLKLLDEQKWEILKRKILDLEPPIKKTKLIMEKKICFDILDTMYKIEKLCGYPIFNLDKTKRENLFIKCENIEYFTGRIQKLNRIITEINTTYFEKILNLEKNTKFKHIGIIKLLLSKLGIENNVIEIWSDVFDLSASIDSSRHRSGRRLEKIFRKYNEHEEIDYNRFWLKILRKFLDSLLELHKVILDYQSGNLSIR